MDFPIYSVGDSAFLEQILISVAMVSGSGNIAAVASIGLLLAVLFMSFQGIFDPSKGVQYGQLVAGWILYTVVFYPTATVVIEDIYTGQVRVVDHVPIGVAASGSIVSTIGLKITETFELGYGAVAPGITGKYFAEPLKIINELRSKGQNPAIFNALDKSLGNSNIRASWENYIKDCTLIKIDLGRDTIENMVMQPIETALKFESRIYGTRIYINDLNGTDLNCTDAFSQLNNATTSALNSVDTQNTLRKLVSPNIERDQDVWGTSTIGSAMDMLRLTTDGAQAFVKASIIEPIYAQAAIGYYKDFHDVSTALMINQAIQGRNTQWAAESTMFMDVVRPMQTFFEGFVYAVTPIIAILLVMGAKGIGMAGKYLQVILWIQLWMPILSIINLYIVTAASQQLLSYAPESFTSMYALNGMDEILQTWIATGGMLAASTPVISFFLVSGSSYAFTGLAGRLGGQDHINEKINSPDAIETAPVMKGLPEWTHDSFRGSIRTGTENLAGNINIGQALQDSVSSSQQNLAAAQLAYTQQWGNAYQSASTHSEKMAIAESLGKSIKDVKTGTLGALNDKVTQIQQRHGLTDTEADQVRGILALQATGTAGVTGKIGKKIGKGGGTPNAGEISGNLGVRGNVAGTAEHSDSRVEAAVMELSNEFTEKAGFTNQHQAQLAREVSNTATNLKESSFGTNVSQTASNSLLKSASDVQAHQRAYDQISSFVRSGGIGMNASIREVAPAVAMNGNAREALQTGMHYADSSVRAHANKLAANYREMGMSADHAAVAGQLVALLQSGNKDDMSAALSALGHATGFNTGLSVGHGSNADLADNGPVFGSTKAATAGMPIVSQDQSLPGNVKRKLGAPLGSPSLNHEGTVLASNAHSQAQIRALGDNFDQGISGQILDKAIDGMKRVKEKGVDFKGYAFGAVDDASERWLKGSARFWEGVKGATSGFWNGLLTEGQSAWESGVEGWNKFREEKGAEFAAAATQHLMSRYNLTHNQARVLAAEYGFNGIDRDQALEDLRGDYALRDEHGNRIKGADGRWVLSEKSEQLVDLMAASLRYGAADNDNIGSYTKDVAQANMALRSITR